MVMKRSSHRQAIRWILQELARRINQHRETAIDQTCSAEAKPNALRRNCATDA
jgi:Tfp pilus assembly protein FimT